VSAGTRIDETTSDAEVLQMAYAAREHGTRFPGVGQLVVAHGISVARGEDYAGLP
jgi:hypothetical protein